jgi:hypothetical protein
MVRSVRRVRRKRFDFAVGVVGGAVRSAERRRVVGALAASGMAGIVPAPTTTTSSASASS